MKSPEVSLVPRAEAGQGADWCQVRERSLTATRPGTRNPLMRKTQPMLASLRSSLRSGLRSGPGLTLVSVVLGGSAVAGTPSDIWVHCQPLNPGEPGFTWRSMSAVIRVQGDISGMYV